MRVTLGSRSYDLATRAVVIGVGGAEREADLVEVEKGDGPRYAAAGDDTEVEQALAAGAVLLRLARPTAGALRRCAEAGVAVLVPEAAEGAGRAAGLPPERILPDRLLVDVTSAACLPAAVAVGFIRGGRVVRTTDARGARRVCAVLAAVLEAR